MSGSQKNTILVAPLNWGLGHATRCIPVIRALLRMDATVVLSAEGGGRNILQTHFPELPFLDIPGISVTYPRKGNMAISMLSQLPSIRSAIRREHEMAERMIDQHSITHIISDNRYGLYSRKVKTAFVSHQLNIQTPLSLAWTKPLLDWIHHSMINRFDEIWIPDTAAHDNLSGELSVIKGIKSPVAYTGPLSRFSTGAAAPEKIYDIIAMLSGPEPLRSLLEEKLVAEFRKMNKRCLLIRGTHEGPAIAEHPDLKIIPGISDSELLSVLHPETLLISRPGYSTLMDLVYLKHSNLLFIPTPGQTEQEYLARRMQRLYGIPFIEQHESLPDSSAVSKPITVSAASGLQSILNHFLGNN